MIGRSHLAPMGHAGQETLMFSTAGSAVRPALHAAVLAAMLLLGPGSTGVLQAQSSATAAAAAPVVFTLSPGDRLGIAVFGQPDLSGEFMVDPMGDVTLPLVGPIDATGASPSELQRRITARLAAGFLRDPNVTVRIVELRAITVVGDVRSPGSYPFRPGMSALTALALAGGTNLTQQRESTLRHEVIQADERVRALTAGYVALLARHARLTAQRDGRKIEFPPSLLGQHETTHVHQILDGERRLLELQEAGHAQALGQLRQQLPRVQAEAKAIGDQQSLERVQLDLLQSQLEDIRTLTQKGLAPRSRLLELQREQARVRGESARQSAAAARVAQLVGEIDMKVRDLENGYRQRVAGELQETQVRLSEAEAALDGARRLRETKAQQARLEADAPPPSGEGPSLIVISNVDGALQPRPVAETTILRPGDILRVNAGPASGDKPVLGPAS